MSRIFDNGPGGKFSVSRMRDNGPIRVNGTIRIHVVYDLRSYLFATPEREYTIDKHIVHTYTKYTYA